MDKDKMEFHCFKCESEWNGTDFPEENDGHDGYNCPECGSDDVGEPLDA